MNDKIKTIGLNELKVTKPVSVWNRDINISPNDLLKGIGKIAIKGASLDWSGVGETALDSFDAAGFQKEPGEIAWMLIYRSLISALFTLTYNYLDLFEDPPDEKDLDKISDLFEKEMMKIEVTIDLEFFQKPGELKLLKDLNAPIVTWMRGLGASDDNAGKISKHLPDYFVTALNEKWRAAPQDYAKLQKYFDTPFTRATGELRGWLLYNQWLKSQVSDRMFGEAFGVEDVYVPLRAYSVEKIMDEEKNIELGTKKIVFNLEKDLKKWLNNFSSDTAVRFICGGPGSGKSTFTKIFATRIANEMRISTLFIPLHLFDASKNLISAMETYIKENKFLSGNPLDSKDGIPHLLIIFDGLDELALLGKAASEVANAFVEEVMRRIHHGNVQGLQRQVIITGRTIAIQSVASKLREEKQISYLLPYLFKDTIGYTDPENLLEADQRIIWWQLYGKAVGKDYLSMPDILQRASLEEITSQPLLNYLVALSYSENRREFTDDTTLNQIYADLISEVYRRQYEGGRVSAYVGELKEHQFVRVLEEIALAIWHGDGNRATVSSIQEKCSVSGIHQYLDVFQEGAKRGVTRLLTAFYFRQSENRRDGEPTFEFTHKSFGEYLTGVRLLRVLKKIKTQRKRRLEDPDGGWSEKESMKSWAEFCAPKAMDEDLMRFINNELVKIEHRDLSELQQLISDLLTYTINNGLPFPSTFSHEGFKQHLMLARNAEESLLGVHFSIARITKQLSKLNLESDTAFGEWISRLRGQRRRSQNKLALKSLGFLDLSFCVLYGQDFHSAILVGAKLEAAKLEEINFTFADLTEANLARANLTRANLAEAILTEADLAGADLTEANLTMADLRRADLTVARLRSANLTRANLTEADLTRADLPEVKLTEANLAKADFSGADLTRVNLTRAILTEADLTGADLTEANLARADLTRADLSGAILTRAELTGAGITGANLAGADLIGANLTKAQGAPKVY